MTKEDLFSVSLDEKLAATRIDRSRTADVKRLPQGADLAELYGVETKMLNRAVKRNPERFPGDFMFQLTAEEIASLRFQFGTPSWGGRRYLPYVFTEHGVLMLGNVLKSEQAVEMSLKVSHCCEAFGLRPD